MLSSLREEEKVFPLVSAAVAKIIPIERLNTLARLRSLTRPTSAVQ